MKRHHAAGAAAAQLPPSATRGCLRRCRFLVTPILVLFLCFLGVVLGNLDSCPDGYGDIGSLGFRSGSAAGGFGLEDVCTGPGSYCFPSTLPGFFDEKDATQREGSELRPGIVAFQMENGEVVSCSVKNSLSGLNEVLGLEETNDEERVASCKATHVAHVWKQMLGGQVDGGLDEYPENVDTILLDGSSSPRVEISPPVLDWGTNTLYSPSLASFDVFNLDNRSFLHVYDLFSSDQQFYPYNFEKLALGPGKSTSVSFVFLPSWLGLSSAHLVMQTNFGGFIIHAKGVAVESPYQIEPLVDGSLRRNFSLYNPFDNALLVDEVTAWLSVSSGTINRTAQVVCSKKTSFQPSDVSSEWLSLPTSDNGVPWVDIRPYKQWVVLPRNADTVFEMNLLPHFGGRVFGAICIQLKKPMSDEGTDAIILPVKIEAQKRRVYHGSTGLLSAFLEPPVAYDVNGKGLILSLSIRNDAPYLLSVVKISELTEDPKLFQVNYMEGLILYSKSDTHVALISYNDIDSDCSPFDIPIVSSDCKLSIVTNDSVSIEIPCQDLVTICSRHRPCSSPLSPESSYVDLTLEKKEKSMNAKTGSLGSLVEEPLSIKPKLLVVKADELVLGNWRSQGSTNKMSVLEDHELLFPPVEVGRHYSKWITVHNPSQKPVVMQLVLNSGVLVDQCRSDVGSSENTFLRSSARIGFTETQDGFSIADSGRTEAFIHPHGSALFGPVVFRPSKRCMWRSSALIRNNLSGIEWLPLRAFGGSHSLVILEGSEPVKKLEFKLDLPMNVNLSTWDVLPHTKTTSTSCIHLLFKELYAKNTGELPLEVLKLDVSGSTCGLGGFMIHNCKGFDLAPGESKKLLISYQADFSSAIIHRDLELAMATGIFVIPMKAIIPVQMLKSCQRSFFRSVLWNSSVLIFAAASIAFLVIFRIIPHAYPSGAEYYFLKNEKTITTINSGSKTPRLHRNVKKSNFRPAGENEKSEAGYVSRHFDCSNCVSSSSINRTQTQQQLDHQRETTQSSPSFAAKPMLVVDNSDVLESPQGTDLTVQIVREKGRRRKRRTAAKFDVSSSQSGNSTPSSPLSPNATPKVIWPLSPGTADIPFSQMSEDNHQKSCDTEVAEARAPEADKHIDANWLLSAQVRSNVTVKSTARPTLLPSATFPCAGWRAPVLSVPKTSPIAPYARAPGSKLSKDKEFRREDDVLVKDFTYNIWGNNFSDHLLGRPKEITSKVFDASEGDSQSFFAREPQSLMTLSSARSVSPGHKLPPDDVTMLYQKE